MGTQPFEELFAAIPYIPPNPRLEAREQERARSPHAAEEVITHLSHNARQTVHAIGLMLEELGCQNGAHSNYVQEVGVSIWFLCELSEALDELKHRLTLDGGAS